MAARGSGMDIELLNLTRASWLLRVDAGRLSSIGPLPGTLDGGNHA